MMLVWMLSPLFTDSPVESRVATWSSLLVNPSSDVESSPKGSYYILVATLVLTALAISRSLVGVRWCWVLLLLVW